MCRVLMKYSLFFVNLIFTIIGLGLIGVGVAGIYVLDDLFQSLLEVQLNLKFLPYVVIGLGVFIFLIAFCGCCGSITECQCLLITYAVVMGLLAAGKIYLTVEVFTQTEYLRGSVENYVNNAFNDPRMTFHAIEVVLQCCGKTGPDDYNYTHDGQSYVPSSCCGYNIGDLGSRDETENPTCRKEDAYQIGCTTLIGETIETWAHVAGYVLIGIIIVEIFCLLFSFYVACTITRNKAYR